MVADMAVIGAMVNPVDPVAAVELLVLCIEISKVL
jgi:hypothetical protein